jgi:hypothetical protein
MKEDTKIPLITLVILILTSFIPIIQLTLIYLNGALLYLIEYIFYSSKMVLSYEIDLALAILSLVGYAFAKRRVIKISYVILAITFLSSYISFLTENLKYEKYPYFLYFMAQAIIVILPLLVIGYFKEKMAFSKQMRNQIKD